LDNAQKKIENGMRGEGRGGAKGRREEKISN